MHETSNFRFSRYPKTLTNRRNNTLQLENNVTKVSSALHGRHFVGVYIFVISLRSLPEEMLNTKKTALRFLLISFILVSCCFVLVSASLQFTMRKCTKFRIYFPQRKTYLTKK